MPDTHLQNYVITGLARQGVEATPEQADKLIEIASAASLLRTGGNLDDLMRGIAFANYTSLSDIVNRRAAPVPWYRRLWRNALDCFWGSEVL